MVRRVPRELSVNWLYCRSMTHDVRYGGEQVSMQAALVMAMRGVKFCTIAVFFVFFERLVVHDR